VTTPIFISYSRSDEEAVKVLAKSLQSGQRAVWLDEDLGGGDSWWNAILDHIREAPVFIAALSDSSIRSKPCRAELDYALALGIPVVPVKVGHVTSMRAIPIAEMQIIDFTTGSAAAAFAIVAAIDLAIKRPRAVPLPEPTPPPMPFEYLRRLGRDIEAVSLTPEAQENAVAQLRRALGDEEDDSVRQDIIVMLRRMLSKPYVTLPVAGEIEKALASVSGGVPKKPRGAGVRTATPTPRRISDSRNIGALVFIVAAACDAVSTFIALGTNAMLTPWAGLSLLADASIVLMSLQLKAGRSWPRVPLVILAISLGGFNLKVLPSWLKAVSLGYAGIGFLQAFLIISNVLLLVSACILMLRRSG